MGCGVSKKLLKYSHYSNKTILGKLVHLMLMAEIIRSPGFVKPVLLLKDLIASFGYCEEHIIVLENSTDKL